MAVLIANPDGSSNAKAGDVVVTGGGIFQKNADGSSTRLEGLNDFIGKDTTKNYNVLSTIAKSYAARESSRGGSSGNTVVATNTQKPAKEEKYTPTTVDDNGIVSGIVGFTPVDYSSGSAASSSGLNKIVGYVVLSLVGLVVLDRLVDKGAK